MGSRKIQDNINKKSSCKQIIDYFENIGEKITFHGINAYNVFQKYDYLISKYFDRT